ncbi:hypothetical protein BCR33DRAFT_722001 [Rhizoclosmatium globosum]|uniref:G-protein coupled receptors family 1 profile domain-containing protein n=1 Tax=Rhizoclosmatium globosum TaxID=329046 RepID=A0A1Y2BP10_9FUNG|nr:hypothetical protein BCR33DRAFT_722001 [Rhizoclosmatium globosum]|eukprot:ORY36476.1 hypothetical protein BCR33DRAFT_722001 [Rhizoclosmatium globosum]
MNQSNEVTAWSADSLELASSHTGTALSLLGAVINVAVLISIWRHRVSLLYTAANNLTWIMTLMLATSVCNGLFMAGVDESLAFGIMGDFRADIVCTIGYLFLFVLFTCNLLLCLERHWLVKYQKRLPSKYLTIAGLLFVPFWCCVVASFYISVSSYRHCFLNAHCANV